jgi:hypothetical protein
MLHKDFDELGTNGQKGDWCFINSDAYIFLMWGDDSFKNMSILPVKPVEGKPHWNWNGNREAPTLTPSILVHPYPGWTDGWHGYLTDGKLITV